MGKEVQVSLQSSARELFTKIGILEKDREAPSHLKLFVEQADRIVEKVRASVDEGSLEEERAREFLQLLVDACVRVICHPIVASNNYLRRFAHGVTEAQARHECQQFSVFGLQFDVAQAKLVANAPTEEAYMERLRVLLNEKGIPYENGFTGDLTGKWDLRTVHFTWMCNMARGLGMSFEDVGKIWLALPGTKAFVDATFENYASTDPNTASGAAFAIENWAANGLWKPWIAGMEKLNAQRSPPVNLGYLTYHNLEEEHHSQATLDELFESFTEEWFDADRFLDGAEAMLTHGVQAYYESQLAGLPDRDDTWPEHAVDAPRFRIGDLPRIAQPAPVAG